MVICYKLLVIYEVVELLPHPTWNGEGLIGFKRGDNSSNIPFVSRLANNEMEVNFSSAVGPFW